MGMGEWGAGKVEKGEEKEEKGEEKEEKRCGSGRAGTGNFGVLTAARQLLSTCYMYLTNYSKGLQASWT
jgi:hypothetical protein